MSKSPRPTDTKLLRSEYTLGEMLGQGAFGVVYACAKRGSKEFNFAVKMVDKVETPVAEIKKEAEMMQSLDHPNVVKIHAVYYEKFFVCVVMDKYGGGDMIEGMQRHWKAKGKIPCTKVVHTSRMMCQAIDHLHSNMVVHRDIKGDNYLQTTPDMTDPECRIIVADFGTAVKMKAGERLSAAVGTKIYWPPEFYNLNYGLKVDIWAIGIIMYGVLDGRFPFKGEADAKAKAVKLPSSALPDCQDFIMKMLEKDEEKRASSAQCIAHSWVAGAGAAKPEEAPAPDTTGMTAPAGLREGGANAGIAQRRQELLERMEKAELKKKAGGAAPTTKDKSHIFWANKFEVQDRHLKRTLRYEWWNQEKYDAEKVADMSMAKGGAEQDSKGDVAVVGKMLKDHGIDITAFGKGEAKSLEQFSAEVGSGSALLMLDACEHKKLVRVVDVVLLRVKHGDRYLVEECETFADGRSRGDLNRLCGTKKQPHENTKQVADKLVADVLGMTDLAITWDFVVKDIFEQQEESISYPGVKTVYRKEIIEGKVVSTDEALLSKYGLGGGSGKWENKDSKNNTLSLAWRTEDECKAKAVQLRAPTDESDVSGLVQAPIGFNVEDLQRYLADHKIDPEAFGENKTKTLKEFSTELIKGESTLMVQDGSLLRVVDVVLLRVMKQGTVDTLVEAEERYEDGTKNRLARLPGTKRRPDENQFLTAQRVLKRQLKMDENCVNIKPDSVQILEERKDSPSYPGLSTMYRKRIIVAELIAPKDKPAA